MIFMMLMIFAANHNGSDDIYEDMCLWWRNEHVDRQSQCTYTHTKNCKICKCCPVSLLIVMKSGFQLAENSTSSQAMPCLCHGLCQCIWFCHCLCNCLLVGLKFLKSGKSCDFVNCKCESNCPHDEEL